jgi:hypothetical protein
MAHNAAVASRDDRIASNEGLLRDINDRIEEVSQERGDSKGIFDFLCECGRENCTATVALAIAEYEGVRSDETHFLVFPGHETDDIEDVVVQDKHYSVVRKHPDEAAVAEETDPHRH